MVQYSTDLKDLPKSSGIYIIKNAKTKKEVLDFVFSSNKKLEIICLGNK